MRKKRSKILEAVHSTARGLRSANAIDQMTMREFDRKGASVGPPSRARHSARAAAKSALRKRIAEVRKGLPLTELDRIAELLGISRQQLASALDTSLRTLQRKADAAARLSPAAAARLARIERIHELATKVLGERDKASRWLTTASRALGGEVPLQMLDTDIGTQRVQQELREIKYGTPL